MSRSASEGQVLNRHRRVLIVEDEPNLRQMLMRAVRDMEFIAVSAASAEAAVPLMRQDPAEILVLDLNLPGMSGIEFLQLCRREWPEVQAIILTGYGDLTAAQQAIHLDVVDFLTKPCSLAEIEAALDRALRRRINAERKVPPDDLFRQTATIEEQGERDPQKARTLDELERQCILAALDRHQGNRAAAAAELGISIRKLYYRLAEYQRQGHTP